MKACSYCGRENEDEASRCVECGTEFPSGAAQPAPEQAGIFNAVTVSTAFNPADAQLTRSRLEAAGFHATVAHELSALSMDGYGLTVGGIRVQVPEKEAREAVKFLEESTSADESAET